MNFLLIVLAGITGAVVMALVMSFITAFGMANADMIRAVGSLFTRDLKSALIPGLIIHLFSGIVFAFFYALFIGMAPIQFPAGIILVSTALGTFHGLIVAAFLAIFVAEYHPLEHFRKTGVRVVIAYIIGHICYGFTIGAFFLLTHVDSHLIRV